MKNLSQLLIVLNGLLQEKEIVIGPILIAKLKAMKNKVADFILSCMIEKTDLDVNFSYIDFTEEEGKVTYLASNREIDFQTKVELTDGEKWSTKKRQDMSIGALVTALSKKKGVEFHTKEVEEFVNKYKSYQKKHEFREVEGDDIIKWYNEKTYANDRDTGEGASLHNSCMRSSACRSFFSVYTQSPNVRLLTLIDNENGNLMGRAIVWKNANLEGVGEITYMDRVYVAKQAYINIFKDHAKESGWWYKVVQTNQDMTITNGTDRKGTWLIDCPIADLDWSRLQKPYMDSLKYMTYLRKNGRYVPVMTNNQNNYKELWQSTSGGYSTNSYYVSEHERLLSVARALGIDQATMKVSDDDDRIIVLEDGREYASYSLQEAISKGVNKFVEEDKIKELNPANYINLIPARDIWDRIADESLEVVSENLIEFEKYVNKQNGVNLLIDISTDEEVLRYFKYYLNKKYDDVIHYIIKNAKANIGRFVESFEKANKKKIVNENIDDSDNDDDDNETLDKPTKRKIEIPKGDSNEPVTLESLLKFNDVNIQHMIDFYEKSEANKGVCVSFLKHKIARLKIRFFWKKFNTTEKKNRLLNEQVIPALVAGMNPLDFTKNYLKMSNDDFYKLFAENLNRNLIERVANNVLQNNDKVRRDLLSVDGRELRIGNYYIYKTKDKVETEKVVKAKRVYKKKPKDDTSLDF